MLVQLLTDKPKSKKVEHQQSEIENEKTEVEHQQKEEALKIEQAEKLKKIGGNVMNSCIQEIRDENAKLEELRASLLSFK